MDVLAEILRLTEKALADIDDKVVTVGGDCAVDLAPIAAARARYGDELTVLWIDAHTDVYSPETFPLAGSTPWCCAPSSATARQHSSPSSP